MCHVTSNFQCPHPIAHEVYTHLFDHPFFEIALSWANATKLKLTPTWNCLLILINKDSIHTCSNVSNI
jgi:hypothetical protein